MGFWGPTLYSNDIACDLRDCCNDVYAYRDAETAEKMIFKEFEKIINYTDIDNEIASFWYALADWQWKHGVLKEEVKNKVLELLNNYTGLDEWEEDTDKKTVAKRKAVLDELKGRLQQPMPPVKKPRKQAPKSKHKPGDVIILKIADEKTCLEIGAYGYEGRVRWCNPYYKSDEIAYANLLDMKRYSGYEKYIALLCVKVNKSLYCPRFFEDVYEETGVYVLYDYLSEEEPNLDKLKTCGWCPTSYRHQWIYYFYLLFEPFGRSSNSSKEFTSIETIYAPEEVERFNFLFSQKEHCLEEYWEYLNLHWAFTDQMREKARLESLGIPFDNLLDVNVYNPELCKIDDSERCRKIEAYHKEAEKIMKEEFKEDHKRHGVPW